jgi:hypothetical protein
MNPLTKDIITIGFSSASLLISIISLSISILGFRRSGSLIKLALDFDRQSSSNTFLLTITNNGFHSVKIARILLICGNRIFPAHLDAFELGYGDTTIKISMAGYNEFRPLEVDAIDVIDIANRVYRIKTKHLKEKIRG